MFSQVNMLCQSLHCRSLHDLKRTKVSNEEFPDEIISSFYKNNLMISKLMFFNALCN